jgi:hypothetical protein
MSQKGQLGRDAIDLLIEGMQELAGGASQRLMESWTGLWSNLQDHITLTLKELSEGGALDGAKTGLKALVDAFADLRESGDLRVWGEQHGKIFNALGNALKTTIENLDKFLMAYNLFVTSFWTATQKIAQAQAIYVRVAQALTIAPEARRSMAELIQLLDDFASGAGDFAAEASDRFAELYLGIQQVEEAAVDADAAIGGGGGVGWGGLTGSINQLANDLKQANFEAETLLFTTERLVGHLRAQAAAVDAVAQSLEEYINGMSMDWTMGLEEMSGPTSEWAEITQNTFSDLLGKGFVGELEKFSDLWDAIWQDLAKSMAGILVDAFTGADGGRGGFGGIMDAIQSNRVGALLGGAGMVYSGYEQGGTGGAIQGALGGAMAGATFGPWGALVGGIVGGLAGLFGGSEDRPSSWVNIDSGFTMLRDQDMSPEARQTWIQEQRSIRRDIVAGYREILGIFQDPELFDLVGEMATFTTGGYMDISMDQLGAWLRESYWPQAVQQMFRQALNVGLRQMGVDRETQRQLWQELRNLPGADRMNALRDYIGAVVESSHLLDDMNWQAILDVVSEDSMTTFLGGMADIQQQVLTRMAGLEDMSLLDRAREAQNILDLITQARQAEIQYLQQIQQLQDGINRSIDQQIEQLYTGGLNENQLQQYYADQVNAIMAQLRAGVDSPEALQSIMSELQRYIGLYAGSLGDLLYEYPAGGQGRGTYAEMLIALLEEARGLSDDAFDVMRQNIEDANAELINQLTILNGLLTDINNGDAFDPTTIQPQEVDVTVDIRVTADQAWLDAYVDSRVDSRLSEAYNRGPY